MSVLLKCWLDGSSLQQESPLWIVQTLGARWRPLNKTCGTDWIWQPVIMFHIDIKASNHTEMFQNNNKKGGGCISLRRGVAPTTGLVTFAVRHTSKLQPRGM